MKPYRLLPTIIIVTVFSLTVAVPTATAGSSGPGWADRLTPSTNSGAASQPPRQVGSLITSVDPVTNTIQFKEPNGKIHTFKIDPHATIVVNSAPGTFDQIKVGMLVDRAHTQDANTLYMLKVHEIKPPAATSTP
jgi:hypothetical protein